MKEKRQSMIKWCRWTWLWKRIFKRGRNNSSHCLDSNRKLSHSRAKPIKVKIRVKSLTKRKMTQLQRSVISSKTLSKKSKRLLAIFQILKNGIPLKCKDLQSSNQISKIKTHNLFYQTNSRNNLYSSQNHNKSKASISNLVAMQIHILQLKDQILLKILRLRFTKKLFFTILNTLPLQLTSIMLQCLRRKLNHKITECPRKTWMEDLMKEIMMKEMILVLKNSIDLDGNNDDTFI